MSYGIDEVDLIFDELNEKIDKTLQNYVTELRAIRAGRANPHILDKVVVDYYGTPTPITQMAAIQVPDPRTLVISPWDASTLKNIEKAILASDIGLTPQNDGKVIRLLFPQLTEERRRDLSKEVRNMAEGGKVAIRNIRRDAIDTFKKAQKASEITEDDLKGLEKDMQDLTDKYVKEVDVESAKKEKELMEL